MTGQSQVDRIAAEAFRALRAKARDERGSDTQPLLVVYAVESFLRRLAMSEYAHQMVLFHRGQDVVPMAEALAEMPDRRQSYAAMVERMSYLLPPPERWSDLIGDVIDLIDPLLADDEGHLSHWDPVELAWVSLRPE